MLSISDIYTFLKGLLDPLIFVFCIAAVGAFLMLKSRKSFKGKLFIALSLLFLYLLSIPPVANMMCYLVEKDFLTDHILKLKKLDTIVVLGGGINNNEYITELSPSYQTATRILCAVQYFYSFNAKYLICSGKGEGKITEAEVMKNIAVKLGIPVQKIKLDMQSENTKQHAEQLDKILKDKKIIIGLVTSAYHMKRSEREFRKYFSNIVPIPSDFLYSSQPWTIYSFIPNSCNLLNFAISSREIAGIIWYKLKG